MFKTPIIGAISAAMVAASMAAVPTTAQAASVALPDGSYQVAQWDGPPRGQGWGGPGRGGPGWRGPGGPGPRYYNYPRGHRYYCWRGPGYYGGNYYGNPNAALAAGVLGLALGAAIAGSANQQRYGNDYVAYCSQRYRSFNPATGTFTGYDGRQYRCVMP